MKALIVFLSLTTAIYADLKPGPLLSNDMILQRGQENRIWGWDNAGQKITATFGGKTVTTTTAADGKWELKLPSFPASSEGRELSLTGSSSRTFKDVVIGDIWVCAGQSNMGFRVRQSYDAEIVSATAKYPNIRLVSLGYRAKDTPQERLGTTWKKCAPGWDVEDFSAVGYHYGRIIHEITEVPIGLISCPWGASTVETWLPIETLQTDERLKPMLERGAKNAEIWKKMTVAERKARKVPRIQEVSSLCYNGMIHPILGYGIKGVIWYQGESNTKRAVQYRRLFPLLITEWRRLWGQGDFPFYWVQLADYGWGESDGRQPSSWAELREAQTMALSLPNTGQAVIHDLGEGNDIHPRNKRDVAERLVRWALVKNYGQKMDFQSPTFSKVEFSGGQATLTFDHVGPGLKAFDLNGVRGFVVCGEDRKWRVAKANIQGENQIVLKDDGKGDITAVRYAWGDNPINNVQSKNGLPLTSFRTDDFPVSTTGKE